MFHLHLSRQVLQKKKKENVKITEPVFQFYALRNVEQNRKKNTKRVF